MEFGQIFVATIFESELLAMCSCVVVSLKNIGENASLMGSVQSVADK